MECRAQIDRVLSEKHSILGRVNYELRLVALRQFIDCALRQAAIDSGPTFVESEDYAILLDSSGWRVLERKDISSDFAVALKTRIRSINARCDAITDIRGPEWVSESLERLHATLRAVEGGLLQREAFCAIAGE